MVRETKRMSVAVKAELKVARRIRADLSAFRILPSLHVIAFIERFFDANGLNSEFILSLCTHLFTSFPPTLLYIAIKMSSLQFWKPGTVAPGSTLDRASEVEGNVVSSAPLTTSISIQSARERLPIFKHSAYSLPCSCDQFD